MKHDDYSQQMQGFRCGYIHIIVKVCLCTNSWYFLDILFPYINTHRFFIWTTGFGEMKTIYLCTPAWPNLLFMECILSKGLIPRDSMINWKRSCFLNAWISQFCRRGAPIGRREFAGSRPIAAQLRPPIWGLGWVQRNLILSTGQFKCVGIYTLNKEYRYKCYFL